MKKIFIGSSTESLPMARHLERILRKLGAEVTCWDSIDAFCAGNYTMEELLRFPSEHSAGIFVFNADDVAIRTTKKGTEKEEYIARDNVVLEAGIFLGALGRRAVAICAFPHVHIPTDLEGITYLEYGSQTMEERLEQWLNENVEDYFPRHRKNVLMDSRQEIHNLYTIDDRLHLEDGLYRNIYRIRIMNLASNLFLREDIADRDHFLIMRNMSLAGAIERIMRESEAQLELILEEPNESILRELKYKIASQLAGSSENALYVSLDAVYQMLSQNTIYSQCSNMTPKRFDFRVAKNCMPFGIFNVEFIREFREYNHVKVDLYSDALANESDRRSFVIWQREDPENYSFFVNNFNAVKNNVEICRKPSQKELEEWSQEWMRRRQNIKL